jgi:hypothetical protein
MPRWFLCPVFYGSAFSKLCSFMENTHVQNIILPADASCQDTSNDMGCLCKFLQHMGATTGLEMKLKLLKIPKTKKTDKAIVIQASNWARNTS